LGEVLFFHLQLQHAGEHPQHLLCADRSGEMYRSVADDPGNAAELFELRNSDVLVFLVDGERLSHPVQRHNVKAELALMLQGLKDSDVLGTGRRVAIALTKLDAVHSSPRRQQTEAAFDDIVEHLEAIAGECFSEIQPFKIAASPHSTYQQGHGVDAMFAYWMRDAATPPAEVLAFEQSDRIFMTIAPTSS
jgi:hypothetical protein